MQIVQNERLIKRESRIAATLLGITFLILAAGLFLSIEAERWVHGIGPLVFDLGPSFPIIDLGPSFPIIVTYVIVIVGMILYYIGNVRLRRYGPKYRQDARLRQLLKGLDDRYTLYTFLDAKLPDYILAGPGGVFVLVTRPHTGEIFCRADRWWRKEAGLQRVFNALYGNPLGNPSWDAAQGVQRLRSFLAQRLSADELPEASGLIVFTGEPVRLRIERCSFPVTSSREARRVVTRQKGRLSAEQLSAVRAALTAPLQR